MQAVQILPSSSIHGKKTKITPDSELLFERLITICSNYDLNSALKDKHTHKPMLLFTDRSFMRDLKKVDLVISDLSIFLININWITLFQISETARFLMVVYYYTRFLGKLVVRLN